MLQSHVVDTLKIIPKHKMLIVFFISLQAVANWVAAETLEILAVPKKGFVFLKSKTKQKTGTSPHVWIWSGVTSTDGETCLPAVENTKQAAAKI